MKAHMIATTERVIWGTGRTVTTLCSAEVLDAMPVLDFDIREGHLEAAKTILLCKECLMRGLSPVDGKRYLYGVLPREQALRLNRESEEN